MTALNNAEVAADYISELASEEITKRLGRKLSENEHQNIQSCIHELGLLGNFIEFCHCFNIQNIYALLRM